MFDFTAWVRSPEALPEDGNYLFRVYFVEYQEHFKKTMRIQYETFKVAKRTPKGYRLTDGRWVSAHSKKRLAHPTRKEAILAAQYRKASHIRHLERNLDIARRSQEALTEKVKSFEQ